MLTGPEKIEVIRQYQRESGLTTFVETGSAHGPTTAGVLDVFDEIVTTDIAADNYQSCVLRFWGHPHVRVLHGDSSVWLPLVIDQIHKPALYWLDAHYDYDGRDDRRGAKDTPIEDELIAIFHRQKFTTGSVILVDDARLFQEGRNGYPSIHWLNERGNNNGYVVTLQDDIIRFTPQ